MRYAGPQNGGGGAASSVMNRHRAPREKQVVRKRSSVYLYKHHQRHNHQHEVAEVSNKGIVEAHKNAGIFQRINALPPTSS